MAELDAYGALELTVRTNGHEVIASLEDAGYTIIAPDERPPPIEEDAAYWRKMYEERMALEEDGFAALLADRDRYRGALEWIVDHSQEFTQEIHGYKGYGQALGAVHERARREVEPLDVASPRTQRREQR